ncbi:MAG: preprotein translocase subunit SecA [Nitrospiraceae bacterium]
MSSAVLPLRVDGLAYPEQLTPPVGKLDDLADRAAGLVLRQVRSRLGKGTQFVRQVADHGQRCANLSETDLREAGQQLRPALLQNGFADHVVAKSFAVVREAAHRSIGQRPFDVQLLGGRVMLHNLIAEMDTGEGKTLTASLSACTAALAGIPVHIVTVNDYLAARDAELMGPVYRALGLSVGVIVHGMTAESRQAAYGCDVTYCTNKELVFDYLKDRLVIAHQPSRVHLQLERLYGDRARMSQLLLRGLHYAIVDEADSVLVDEARTPLIIAGRGSDEYERHVYEQALDAARRLAAGREFVIDHRERHVHLTPSGLAHVTALTRNYGPIWTGRHRREDLILQALSALHLFQRDKHYLVHNEKVQIVDEYTGRVMPDRSWERGLHQMVEVKEQCPLGGRQETLARISYQRFFRRFLRLAGMTGTAREVAGELWSVYRLGVVRIPTNRPVRRRSQGDRIYKTAAEKWRAVADTIQRVHDEGRPVLVGTRSVAASEQLSALLFTRGLPHQVLNARQDLKEAAIVARAGEPRRITVATNMAGRGTDIRLSPGVAIRGGLHVIATERHDAGRIDRQLFGRCGRQGDPGTYEVCLSLEDELMVHHSGCLEKWVTARLAWLETAAGQRVGAWLAKRAQRRAERLHSRIRQAVLRMADHLERTLAFAGRQE